MRARHLPRLARIEARTWYESGKYLGSAAPWRIADRAALEAEMTGDFFGDWAGTRRRDGAAIVAREITRALEAHASPLWDNRMGEVTHSPLPRGDSGEWRIVTEAAQ